MPVDHAREHIAQVSVGFDAVEFAGFDQRTDDRPPVTATVASGKEMVLAPERHRADRTFDRIGIEFNAAVMQEAGQTFPARERIADRLGQVLRPATRGSWASNHACRACTMGLEKERRSARR